MKIITLLPVKNEEWVLELTLRNFESFSDEIIVLDDGSTDRTKEIALRHSKVTITSFPCQEKPVDMSRRRTVLLEEGRRRGGTHFIMLDADEIFSEQAVRHLPELLKDMEPGEILLFAWLLVHVKELSFIYEKKQEKNYKDFIFCDDKISAFSQKRLSEDRTPGNRTRMRTIPFEKGCVFHLQNIPLKRNHYKQSWYRCNELLEGKKSSRRINAMYGFTNDFHIKHTEVVRDAFLERNKNLIDTEAGYGWYLDDIKHMFSSKGIIFFEDLDIWNIPELKKAFILETGRAPRPKFYPAWIVKGNAFKNYLKKKLL